jgi:hypothetical protein
MITKEEALELLNISANAGKDEISDAYKQLFSDYQIRLTNAPTPHLKTLYQNNLKKLEDALKLLLPEGIGAGSDDLPSDTPTLQTNSGGNIQKTVSTQQTTTGSTKTAQSKNVVPEKKNSVLLPILGLATVLAVAAAVFIFIQYGGMYNGKLNEVITLKKERDELKKTADNFAPILKNGSMKISNNFNNEIVIAWWSVTYRDKDGNIKKFDSFADGNSPDGAKFRFPSYNVKPGQSVEMQYVSGNSVVWDGSVTTYSMLIQDINSPGLFYLFSGIWNNDAKDGKLFVSKPKYAN